MNQKQLTILVVIGLVLGVAGLVVYKSGKGSYQSTSLENIQKVFPDFPLNDVAQIRIQSSDGELNLSKLDDRWTVEARNNYPADYSKIGKLVQTVWDLKPAKQEQVGESQLKRVNLLPPPGEESEGEADTEGTGLLVEFNDKDGNSVGELIIGKEIKSEPDPNSQYGASGGYAIGRFIRTLGKNPKVYRVSETFSSVVTDPKSWLDRDFFKIKKAKSIKVSSESEPQLNWYVERETESGSWKLVDAEVDESLDGSKTSSFNNVLSSPSFSDVSKEDFDPQVNATITTFDNFQYDLKISEPNDESQRQIQVAVSADLPKERVAKDDESDEDKAKLDQEFQDNLKEMQEKLDKESAFKDWTYLVSNYTVTALTKKRSEIVKMKEAETEETKATTEEESTSTNSIPDFENIDPLKVEIPEDETPSKQPQSETEGTSAKQPQGERAQPAVNSAEDSGGNSATEEKPGTGDDEGVTEPQPQ